MKLGPLITTVLIVGIVVYAGVGYVIVHFVHKFW